MQKFVLILFAVARLFFWPIPAHGQVVISVQTNSSQTNVSSGTNLPTYSEAELQVAAHGVLLRLILITVVAVLGGLVVAGFAIYGAYKAFGTKGVIGVGILIAIGLYMIADMLFSAY